MKNNMHESGYEILTPQGLQSNDRLQKMRFKKKEKCIKCGNCCINSSPVLLKDDMSLFISGILSYGDTYTIREGELIYSSDGSEVYESFTEIIKIREKGDGKRCIFYKGNGECIIYENRPVQCRAYKCWEPTAADENILSGLEKQGLKREDLFGSIDLLMEVINKHNEKCSYKGLSDVLERLSHSDERAVEDIMDMLQYDTYIRPFLKERFDIPEDAMDLILGRPMTDTINAFGFKVMQDGEEYILMPIKDKGEGK